MHNQMYATMWPERNTHTHTQTRPNALGLVVYARDCDIQSAAVRLRARRLTRERIVYVFDMPMRAYVEYRARLQEKTHTRTRTLTHSRLMVKLNKLTQLLVLLCWRAFGGRYTCSHAHIARVHERRVRSAIKWFYNDRA